MKFLLLFLILLLVISVVAALLNFLGYHFSNKCENPDCDKCPFPLCKRKSTNNQEEEK